MAKRKIARRRSRPDRGFAKKPFLIASLFVLTLLALPITIILERTQQSTQSEAAIPSTPPPAGGYFQLVPAGQFSKLPSDEQAASMVHRSSWEPRPENYVANHTVAPSSFKQEGYSGMENSKKVFSRITGNFTGTTDEIIQWVAAKWGLPDDVIRAQSVTETYWYQNRKDATGKPINGSGYGDINSCETLGFDSTPRYPQGGPSSFGLPQVKWCAMKDKNASGYAGWPWIEDSTAYSLDSYGAVIRACYEGWDSWLSNKYTAGDLWGCVGRWFSGDWNSTAANNYIAGVQTHFNTKPWLTWPDKSSQLPSPTSTPSVPTNTPVPVPPTNAPVVGTSTSTLSPQPSVVSVRSLSISTRYRPATVSYTLSTTGTVKVNSLVVAVRKKGGNYDFPLTSNVTLSGRQSFSQKRTFSYGTYTYWVAYNLNGTWVDLSPKKTFTVR